MDGEIDVRGEEWKGTRPCKESYCAELRVTSDERLVEREIVTWAVVIHVIMVLNLRTWSKRIGE